MKNVEVKCDKCGQLAYMVLVNMTCIRGNCNGTLRPLKTQTEPVDEVPCSAGLDTLFFMEKRLPHLLNIADELLTWCIEEDKKGIYKDLLKKYRKEHEAIIAKGV